MRLTLTTIALIFLSLTACNKLADVGIGSSETAVITAVTSLRKVAGDEKKVIDPKGSPDKKVSNWIATLYRGEEVTVRGEEGDWLSVRASDDSEGWVRKAATLPLKELGLATTFGDLKTFRRPDISTLDSKRVIKPRTVLFVVEAKDKFSRVNYPHSDFVSRDTWILTEEISTAGKEYEAAKILGKVAYLKSRKDASADELYNLAKDQFAGTRVLATIEEEMHAAAAQVEEEPPTISAEEMDAGEEPGVEPGDDEVGE